MTVRLLCQDCGFDEMAADRSYHPCPKCASERVRRLPARGGICHECGSVPQYCPSCGVRSDASREALQAWFRLVRSLQADLRAALESIDLAYRKLSEGPIDGPPKPPAA